MEIQVHTRLDTVSEALWERATPSDFFFRSDFLRVLSESGVEAARYRYVVLLDDGAPVGAAVLSAFTLRLDLLAGSAWVRGLRRLFPSLLDIPMVCCGIPASFGQHHLHVLPGADLREAFRRVDRVVESWARDEGCALVLWKEWCPKAGLASLVLDRGYVVLPTLPDHVIDPLPESVDTFVGAMRSAYRRRYRSALELMEGPGPVWRAGGLRLEERAFGPADAAAFHCGYVRVMERAQARLETYPLQFFDRLARSELGARILHLAHAGDTGITALLIPAGDTLTFALVAKERRHYEDGLYTTLLRCITLLAIRRRFRTLRLGQTSGFSKSSVGARPRRLETYIRMRDPLRHRAFRHLGPLLFPETVSPDLRVFRHGLSAPGIEAPFSFTHGRHDDA